MTVTLSPRRCTSRPPSVLTIPSSWSITTITPPEDFDGPAINRTWNGGDQGIGGDPNTSWTLPVPALFSWTFSVSGVIDLSGVPNFTIQIQRRGIVSAPGQLELLSFYVYPGGGVYPPFSPLVAVNVSINGITDARGLYTNPSLIQPFDVTPMTSQNTWASGHVTFSQVGQVIAWPPYNPDGASPPCGSLSTPCITP